MTHRVALMFALSALLFPGPAPGQPYPAKSVRVIVPFSPGGSADNLMRTIQAPLTQTLGQQIVIDNRGGASAIIGTELAATAPPDGYTLLLTTTTFTTTPSLVRKLPYDAARDFAGISLIGDQPNILVVHPSLPATSVTMVVALARNRPDTLTFASGGSGSSPHLSGELLNLIAGIRTTHVPFKGSGPGVTAVIAGQVSMMFAGPLALEQYIRAGRLRALAVADRKRSALLPDVPTMQEAGYAGVETGTWYGMLAPVRTPRPIIDRVYGALSEAVNQPDTRARLVAQGVDVVVSSPTAMDTTVRDEIAKWAKLVKAARIPAE